MPHAHDNPEEMVLEFQIDVYGVEPILAASHRFTDRLHVHVERTSEEIVSCILRPAREGDDLSRLAGELQNAALDESLRARLRARTEPVRALILAQAFSKANLVAPELDAISTDDDSLEITLPDEDRGAVRES